MPLYGQSPWQEAAGGMENMGTSMSRIAMAQQIGRMRAQQFAAQMALRQQQMQIQQDRLGLDQQETEARIPLINAQTDEAKSVSGKNQQEVDRQNKMDELAHAIAVNMFKQRVPGGVPAVMSGELTGSVGPTQANADFLNQGDLVRNAVQLMAMRDPNGITTMMMGKNIPQGDVNYNPLTQERVEGLPPRAPTGAPIDPTTGMTPYQIQQLLLQRARIANDDKRIAIETEKMKSSPDYMMSHSDDSGSAAADNSSGKKKPTRAQAAEYVKKYGSPEAAKKQLVNEGFDTSGYAD